MLRQTTGTHFFLVVFCLAKRLVNITLLSQGIKRNWNHSLICLNKKKYLFSVFKVPPEESGQASHLYFTYILMLLQS